MELTIRDLAFLEYEMKQIKEDHDRDGEDRYNASSVLGKIEDEIEEREQKHLNEETCTANAGP